MLIKLRAKVMLASEEQMEAEGKYDLGDIAKSKDWVWRTIAIPVAEVYKIIEFNDTKSIVETYDGEKILINEIFESLFKRWEEVKVTEGEVGNDKKETTQEEEE